MNLSEYKTHVSRYIDVNGGVKPRIHWRDSGNGLIYTGETLAVAKVFFNSDEKNYLNYAEYIRNNYVEKGNVARTPNNTYGQQQWDDYLGIAAGCIAIGETKVPREILWYALTHLFVFNTDRKLEGRDFLGRFPHVWVLMTAAAFPKIRPLMKPLFRLLSKWAVRADEIDGAGPTNLKFVWYLSMHMLDMKDLFKNFVQVSKIKEHSPMYFDAEHPIPLAVKEKIDEVASL